MEKAGTKKEQTRNRIKTIGKVKFMSYGLTDTMFVDIAKEAKIDRRTIYRYYPSKEHLLLDITIDIWRNFIDKFVAIQFDDEMNGFQKVSYLFSQYFVLLKETPEMILFLGMVDLSVGQKPSNRAIYIELDEYGKQIDLRLSELIKQGQLDGSVAFDKDPLELAITINNSLIALATRIAIYTPAILLKGEGFAWQMLVNQATLIINAMENK